jgi:hypothetical protein
MEGKWDKLFWALERISKLEKAYSELLLVFRVVLV